MYYLFKNLILYYKKFIYIKVYYKMNDENDELQFYINNKNISFSNDNLINLNEVDKEQKISEGNKNSNSLINNNNLDNSLDNSKKSIIKLEINNNEINQNISNPYIVMNSKNIFTKIDKKYINEINKRFKKIYFQKDESLLKLSQLSKSINENLLEYLYPKKESDYFQICLEISKLMKKQNILKKYNLEKNIVYFFSNRVYFKYAHFIQIDKKFINNCGPILCQIYTHLEDYKIKDFNSLIKVIKEIKNQKIDVLKDYLFYCNNKDLKPEYTEKVKYFKSIKKKYNLNPELIFLINLLHLITKVIINFDFEGEKFTTNEIHFFYIIIFNIKYIIKDLQSIKLNLINRNFQYGTYGVYMQKIIRDFKYTRFKKNSNIFNKHIYKEKWDFENDFALDCPKLIKKEKSFFYKDNIDNIFNLNSFENEENFNYKNNKLENKKINNVIIDDFVSSHNIELNPNELKKRSYTFTHSTNKLLIKEENEKKSREILIEYYKEIVDDCIYILQMIFITLNYLDCIENLYQIELIFNESYYYEYSSFFRNVCKLDIGNSHILDFIYNKLINMSSISFEINFFDLVTINRILKILYNNNNLSSLKFSFFSSDHTYFPEAIYKIYNQNLLNKSMKKNINDFKKNSYHKLEDIFFKNIYPNFEKFLNYFFEIIKEKNLKNLGLNINFPASIVNDEKYIIIIFKFILNIILLSIENVESCINILIILSVNLVINGNKLIFFDKFLENINNNNDTLLNLNIQMKFYNIINIHKLINNKLKILNIGDFDIFTLKHFVFNISKYNFCKNSSLEKISISLNKTITNLDDITKLFIAKLFYIKIKNLLFINLYTNIKINNKNEFEDIINIIKDNWISSYLILFNRKSYGFINNNLKLIKKEDINYITKKNKKPNKNIIINNEINDKNDISDEIFFYLKYIFNKKYGKEIDFYSKKKIISKILKYLYATKIATFNFDFEDDKKVII